MAHYLYLELLTGDSDFCLFFLQGWLLEAFPQTREQVSYAVFLLNLVYKYRAFITLFSFI